MRKKRWNADLRSLRIVSGKMPDLRICMQQLTGGEKFSITSNLVYVSG